MARNAAVCIVSDHGMARVDHELNLNVAFVKAGLITPAEREDCSRGPAISGWKALPWSAAGSAAIVLHDCQRSGDDYGSAETSGRTRRRSGKRHRGRSG